MAATERVAELEKATREAMEAAETIVRLNDELDDLMRTGDPAEATPRM